MFFKVGFFYLLNILDIKEYKIEDYKMLKYAKLLIGLYAIIMALSGVLSFSIGNIATSVLCAMWVVIDILIVSRME